MSPKERVQIEVDSFSDKNSRKHSDRHSDSSSDHKRQVEKETHLTISATVESQRELDLENFNNRIESANNRTF